MKTWILVPALAWFLPASSLQAAEPAKPQVSLSVKRQLTTTGHDSLGPRADSRSKTVTLRVTVTNTSSALLEGLTLSGTALLEREIEGQTRITSETLKAV